MKNKRIIKMYIYILTAGKLTKRAKGIYKKVSNAQNLRFKKKFDQIQINPIWNLILDHRSIQE
jgi:hypothetical protein